MCLRDSYKAGLVPVNTNYRYLDDELAYLWENADAVAVVFHGCFSDRVEAVKERVPQVRQWLWIDDGSDECPEWAVPYEQAVAVVLRDKKASTSYIQRRLQIGYNRAASLIERMENEGIVGPANHAGKREILVDGVSHGAFDEGE